MEESGYTDVAKAYILYRKQREKIRNLEKTTLDYKDVVDNLSLIHIWGALTWQTTDGVKVPDTLRVETKDAVPRLERFHREYDGKGGLISVYYSITSLMACTEELFRTVFLSAKERQIPAECHMNEYASEVLDFMER